MWCSSDSCCFPLIPIIIPIKGLQYGTNKRAKDPEERPVERLVQSWENCHQRKEKKKCWYKIEKQKHCMYSFTCWRRCSQGIVLTALLKSSLSKTWHSEPAFARKNELHARLLQRHLMYRNPIASDVKSHPFERCAFAHHYFTDNSTNCLTNNDRASIFVPFPQICEGRAVKYRADVDCQSVLQLINLIVLWYRVMYTTYNTAKHTVFAELQDLPALQDHPK